MNSDDDVKPTGQKSLNSSSAVEAVKVGRVNISTPPFGSTGNPADPSVSGAPAGRLSTLKTIELGGLNANLIQVYDSMIYRSTWRGVGG